MKNILTLNSDPELLKVLARVTEGFGYKVVAAQSFEEAQTVTEKEAIDAVLIGGGFSEEDETTITTFFQSKEPAIPVVKHYGGGSGLILSELKGVLSDS